MRIETAFTGPGARDAFEMALRAVAGGRYLVDADLVGPEALPAARGRYLFRLIYGTSVCELRVRPGIVKDEYINLSRTGASGQDQEDQLEWLKRDMAPGMVETPAARCTSSSELELKKFQKYMWECGAGIFYRRERRIIAGAPGNGM